MTRAERQRLIRDLVIEHPQYSQALSRFGSFHFPVKGGLPSRGTIAAVIGNSRTGKTFAAKAYAVRFPASAEETGVHRQVLYVDMPSEGGGGLRGILDAFARALGLQVTLRMTNPLLTTLVLRALASQGVELILLDEFDQVFRENDRRLLGAGRGLLRKIADLGTLTVVCIGLENAYHLLRDDAQIVGRGGLPFQHLRAYDWNNNEERLVFRKVCDTFDSALPFDEQAGMATSDFASRLHWATNGNIGHLKFYIEAAAAEAMNEEAVRLDRTHFATVYDARKPLNQTFNPFLFDLSLAPKSDNKSEKLKNGPSSTVFAKKQAPNAWA